MSFEPDSSPRSNAQPETRKLMYVFGEEPTRTGLELVEAMRRDWRQATELLDELSDPELMPWLGARPDGEFLVRALRGDRNGAARFLRLQAEFNPDGELEFRGRVVSDEAIVRAAQNAAQAADNESPEVAADTAWLLKIYEQRILYAIAAVVDDSEAGARIRADARLQEWALQAQTALDEFVASWVRIVTGVDVKPPPLTLASLLGGGPESTSLAAGAQSLSTAYNGLTPMQVVLRQNNLQNGNFGRSDAGEFCAQQLLLWTGRHNLEVELRSNLTQFQDSPAAVTIFQQLLEGLPEAPDYNFEILVAVKSIADRHGETLGQLFSAAFDDAAVAEELDRAVLAANQINESHGVGARQPEVPHDLGEGVDVSHEARAKRRDEWLTSLSKELKSAASSELGRVITTRMIIEELLAGERR